MRVPRSLFKIACYSIVKTTNQPFFGALESSHSLGVLFIYWIQWYEFCQNAWMEKYYYPSNPIQIFLCCGGVEKRPLCMLTVGNEKPSTRLSRNLNFYALSVQAKGWSIRRLKKHVVLITFFPERLHKRLEMLMLDKRHYLPT